MDYEEVKDALFLPRLCSTLFFSCPPMAHPMLKIAALNGVEDFLNYPDQKIETLKLLGIGKYPILITEYDWKFEQTLDPVTAIQTILEQPEDQIDYQAWLFLVNKDMLLRMISAFYEALEDRADVSLRDDEERDAIFFEVRKDENLANVFYSTAMVNHAFKGLARIS